MVSAARLRCHNNLDYHDNCVDAHVTRTFVPPPSPTPACRGSELRFTQDAKWHNPNGSNNIAAVLWVLLMQLEDGSTLPVPHIFCHAQRDIRKGAELLLDWGDECWAAYHQTQVCEQCNSTGRYIEAIQADERSLCN
jgi:hypothetical protein